MEILRIIWNYKCAIKKRILRLLYKNQLKMERSVLFRDGFKLLIEKEGSVEIGYNVFFNNNCSINAKKNIIIGNNCLFGEDVKIYDHNHVFKEVPRLISEQGFKCGPVIIGNNCWVGSGVIILKSISIGNNCVVAAGTVVNKNIPSNSIMLRDGSINTIVNPNQ